MRNLLLLIAISGIFYACSANNYRLTDYEKGKLRGYHANEANRLIDINKKNRKANKKASEKYRQEESARLSELNRSSQQEKGKKTGKIAKAPFMQ